MHKESVSINIVPFLLKGDRATCSKICNEYLSNGFSIIQLYENVLKTSLYEVGLLWEQNKISVAKEHIATAITEGILNEFYSKIITNKQIPKKVILTTVESEEHQVGIKMVSDVFEMKRWEAHFLGSGVPISDLLDLINEMRPHVVAISLSIHFNYPGFVKMVESIHGAFPKIKILAGGQAFERIDKSLATHSNLYTTITNLDELAEFIENL